MLTLILTLFILVVFIAAALSEMFVLTISVKIEFIYFVEYLRNLSMSNGLTHVSNELLNPPSLMNQAGWGDIGCATLWAVHVELEFRQQSLIDSSLVTHLKPHCILQFIFLFFQRRNRE